VSTRDDEWDTDVADANSAPAAPGLPAGAAIAAAADLTETLQAAVQATLRHRMDKIAAAAIDKLLDEATLAALSAAAEKAAVAALTAPADADAEEPAELYYPDVLKFVTNFLIPIYRRRVTAQGNTWCAQWWKHAEAVTRLDAMWRAWEHLRMDGTTGGSVWLRDHCDYHMGVLLSSDGPFKGCTPEKHADRLQPLPIIAPPEGWH